MRRREFIAGLGGVAALAMPGIASAQQGEHLRRVAVRRGHTPNGKGLHGLPA
jgi:hypothetical protein